MWGFLLVAAFVLVRGCDEVLLRSSTTDALKGKVPQTVNGGEALPECYGYNPTVKYTCGTAFDPSPAETDCQVSFGYYRIKHSTTDEYISFAVNDPSRVETTATGTTSDTIFVLRHTDIMTSVGDDYTFQHQDTGLYLDSSLSLKDYSASSRWGLEWVSLDAAYTIQSRSSQAYLHSGGVMIPESTSKWRLEAGGLATPIPPGYVRERGKCIVGLHETRKSFTSWDCAKACSESFRVQGYNGCGAFTYFNYYEDDPALMYTPGQCELYRTQSLSSTDSNQCDGKDTNRDRYIPSTDFVEMGLFKAILAMNLYVTTPDFEELTTLARSLSNAGEHVIEDRKWHLTTSVDDCECQDLKEYFASCIQSGPRSGEPCIRIGYATADYQMVFEGSCESNGLSSITSSAECKKAAGMDELGLVDDNSPTNKLAPGSGCSFYVENEWLYWNDDADKDPCVANHIGTEIHCICSAKTDATQSQAGGTGADATNPNDAGFWEEELPLVAAIGGVVVVGLFLTICFCRSRKKKAVSMRKSTRGAPEVPVSHENIELSNIRAPPAYTPPPPENLDEFSENPAVKFVSAALDFGAPQTPAVVPSISPTNHDDTRQRSGTFAAGARVELHGFTKSKALNGSACTVESYVASSDRYIVVLGDNTKKSVPGYRLRNHNVKRSTSEFSIEEIDQDDDLFYEVEDKIKADANINIKAYTTDRVAAGMKPLVFVVTGIEMITNKKLRSAFNKKRAEIRHECDQARVRRGYHGTRAMNLENIARSGLLPVGHPSNPSQATDPGWFGDPRHGVYVSRHVDYALKYSNDLHTLELGDEVKILMFDVLPGRCYQVDEVQEGMMPTRGYHSHTSPKNMEWFLFNEAQLVPTHIVTIKAFENDRTMLDDGADDPTPPTHEPALAAGWVEHVDPSSGRTYYANSSAGLTTWNREDCLVPTRLGQQTSTARQAGTSTPHGRPTRYTGT